MKITGLVLALFLLTPSLYAQDQEGGGWEKLEDALTGREHHVDRDY